LLYRRHTPMLFALARRRTGNPADAEDAVHDAWIRAVAGLPRFRGASSLRTWLTGILINRLREGERARRSESLDDVPEPSLDPPPSLPIDIDPIDLRRALDLMPAGYHEVLLLHDVEGFTHEEISGILGIEIGTSKSQLARGRRWLRSRLTGDERKTDE
jgi:RNA polymerase sigma-70 factor, ECF subfamily